MPSTFFKSTALIATLASLFSKVAAHGFVNGASVGGTWYQGFDETTWENKANGSPILITSYLVPLYDVWSSQIACGLNPKAPGAHAPVKAGDSIGWKWMTHNDLNWVHDKGTHRTFIGSCKGDCNSISPNDVEWIELGSEYTGQQGYDSGSNTWAVQTLHDGNMWYDKVPNLPKGKYLVRNELTALHYSYLTTDRTDQGHPWGTEFYPTCLAIEITDSDNSFVPGHTWKFPGAYQVDEPGHYNPDFLSNPGGVVMAALNDGQGYTNYYGDSAPSTPSSSSDNTNSGNNSGNNSNNNSNNNTPANPAAASSSAASTTPSIAPQVCKRGSRRARAEAKAKKMRRAHKALRRSEH